MIIHVHEIVKMSYLSCHGSEQFLMRCTRVEHVVTMCWKRVSVEENGWNVGQLWEMLNLAFLQLVSELQQAVLSHYRLRNLKTVCHKWHVQLDTARRLVHST